MKQVAVLAFMLATGLALSQSLPRRGFQSPDVATAIFCLRGRKLGL
jgi:hypothetical protein